VTHDQDTTPPAPTIIGFAGYSGSGKTTLIEQVIPELKLAGFSIALIKHAHHSFDIDHPGKDSYRHRKAGAQQVLVSSANRWALMHEMDGAAELDLAQLLAKLSPCDMVIIEGFKRDPIPKIEVHRKDAPEPALLHRDDPHIIAIATDEPLDTNLPQLDVNEPSVVAQFIIEHHANERAKQGGASTRVTSNASFASTDVEVVEIEDQSQVFQASQA
jgi:molybdopterin-guanine dinucleotide biosynthesis adapter protein